MMNVEFELPMEQHSLFRDLKSDKTVARENFMTAMANLESVYRTCAHSASDADYATPENARCWDTLFAVPQYEAAKQAAAAYLVFPFWRNKPTVEYILQQDSSHDGEDLFMMAYERVVRCFVKIFRNVVGSYQSKKGMVTRAEGYALYTDSIVSRFLIDKARTYNSAYGRNTGTKTAADLYDQAQRIFHVNELAPGMVVVRKGNRVGSFGGIVEMNCKDCVVVNYEDGTDYVPSSRAQDSIRIFHGDASEARKAARAQAEGGYRKTNNSLLSLDEYLGDSEEDDDGLTLKKLIAGAGSCEEESLSNECSRQVRKGFLMAMEEARGDYAKSLMLMYYVMDSIRNELTHTKQIQNELRQQDPMALMHQIHQLSCLMLNIEASAHALTIDPATIRNDFSAKELTTAKNKAKSLLRLSIQYELAA